MTNDRHDPEATTEPGDEFWGRQAEWAPRDLPPTEREGLGATIARWWDGLLGGTEGGVRAHGRTSDTHPGEHAPASPDERSDVTHGGPRRDHRADPDPDPDADDMIDAQVDVDDAWELEPEPEPIRRSGVDPLIARLGGLAVILTLAAPLAVGFSASDSEADGALLTTTASTPTIDMFDDAASDPAATQAASASEATVPSAPVPLAAAAPTGVEPATPSAPASSAASPSAPAVVEVASLEAPSAAITAPSCGSSYELAAGDYWIRIADAAEVSLADLLAVNDASVDTVLVPGRSICLPVGASTPPPPTTAPPAPASAVSTPAAAPATTAAPNRPATTAPPAPTTTRPSRPSAVPQSEAATIIRDVWPDDLEERALEIAWRESNHRSNVNNYCCYGLFQIHWTAHRSWLATIGVTSVSQLFDPVVNAKAAYTLYQRAGGFGPWGG